MKVIKEKICKHVYDGSVLHYVKEMIDTALSDFKNETGQNYVVHEIKINCTHHTFLDGSIHIILKFLPENDK